MWVLPLLAIPSARVTTPAILNLPALYGLVMKQLAIAAFLLIPVLAFASTLLWSSAEPAPSPPANDSDAHAESIALSSELDDIASREAVTTDSVAGGATTADVFSVFGRCVSAGTDAPLAGSRIEVVRLLKVRQLGASSKVLDLRGLDARLAAPPFGRLDAGSTGDDGVAALAVPPETLWLRVTGDHHPPHVEEITVLRPRFEHQVVVRAGAILEGELVPPDAVAELQQCPDVTPVSGERMLEVMLRRVGERSQLPVRVERGRFRATGLEPGEYAVALYYRLKSHPDHALPVTVPITDVALQPGATANVRLDVTRALPAKVEGYVAVDGEPQRTTDLFLRRVGSVFFASVRIATDAEGRLDTIVPAGEYRISLVLSVEDGPGWIVLPLLGSRSVVPGRTNDLSCDAMRRQARIRLLTAGAEPVAHQQLRIVQAGYSRPGRLSTDGDGWFEFSPVPYGAFEVEWTGGDGVEVRVPVTVPDARSRIELTVRVPS